MKTVDELIAALEKFRGEKIKVLLPIGNAMLPIRDVRTPADEFGIQGVLLTVAADLRLDADQTPVWSCGCGWVNGVNLATCARCARTPNQGYGRTEP